MLGRSDGVPAFLVLPPLQLAHRPTIIGVLNPGGVRFGTAEIYDVLDLHFSVQIVDYVAVGRTIVDPRTSTLDEEVVLFVKLHPTQTLDQELEAGIRTNIRRARSPRHVPAKVRAADSSTAKLIS